MRTDEAVLERMSPYDLFRWAEGQFALRDYYGAVETLEHLAARPDAAGHATTATDELLARAYFHASLLDKAEAASRRLLDAEPDNGYAALLLSRSLERLGRTDEAMKVRARAAALGAPA